MKVEDLIKSLQKYNPKADIGIGIDGYYESDYTYPISAKTQMGKNKPHKPPSKCG